MSTCEINNKDLEKKSAELSSSPGKKAEPDRAEKKAAPAKKAVPKMPTGAAGARRARPAERPNQAKKEEKPEEPSPLEPLLQKFVREIREKAGEDAITEAYINRASGHVPTLVVTKEKWSDVAIILKEDPAFAFDYMRVLSSVDYQTELEVVYQFYSFKNEHQIAIRVKTDREKAEVPSVAHLWKAANWNEREAYDLMGIRFKGHPDLRRIMLPDDWVGHPLRKDYESLDKEG
ncbi:NADH-quinone oxidoreductase subunit C [Thermoactinomyces mirandus]|uniref:NADH-quinone oxidoreductase subunit C n=1 Tax=Thermoactinomyces mirandus TaxID=2756294 RepID=A0A7W1XTM5_9BACL|nr:NADH-quinone oxidoreductase subunit C [Thermoactinomyces mirandus]MBA4602966.1 NADH-quinone oxidoreductase subunit C [Thermoactinomyces mirandus]